jgi:hypothetical protein
VVDLAGVAKEPALSVVPGNIHPVIQVRMAQFRSLPRPISRVRCGWNPWSPQPPQRPWKIRPSRKRRAGPHWQPAQQQRSKQPSRGRLPRQVPRLPNRRFPCRNPPQVAPRFPPRGTLLPPKRDLLRRRSPSLRSRICRVLPQSPRPLVSAPRPRTSQRDSPNEPTM